MLHPVVIQKEIERKRKQEEQQRPYLELPLYEDEVLPQRATEPTKEPRGVVIIDLMGDDTE